MEGRIKPTTLEERVAAIERDLKTIADILVNDDKSIGEAFHEIIKLKERYADIKFASENVWNELTCAKTNIKLLLGMHASAGMAFDDIWAEIEKLRTPKQTKKKPAPKKKKKKV